MGWVGGGAWVVIGVRKIVKNGWGTGIRIPVKIKKPEHLWMKLKKPVIILFRLNPPNSPEEFISSVWKREIIGRL
ncbi:MAG: hypothetical protein P8Y30_08335, partial [candidate division WOR-3 bacterium]